MTIARARFEIPARVKTDPIMNNYLAQTTEDNARSGLRRVQAEMSLMFVFPTVVRIEKTCVVDRTDRSSDRLCLMKCFHLDRSSNRGQLNRSNCFAHRTFHMTWENFWLPRSNHCECDMSSKKGYVTDCRCNTTLLTKVFLKTRPRLN